MSRLGEGMWIGRIGVSMCTGIMLTGVSMNGNDTVRPVVAGAASPSSSSVGYERWGGNLGTRGIAGPAEGDPWNECSHIYYIDRV